MPKIITDIEQGTPAWMEARRGVATASNFDRIITPKEGELSRSADDYICELIAQRYYVGEDDSMEAYQTAAMRNGVMLEPHARAWYEFAADVSVSRVGFIISDCGRFGCSPDGLIGDDGGLEVKCPGGKTHIRYLLDGVLPAKYKPQVHASLAISGRMWWDFVSYCRGLPPLCVRVERDSYTDRVCEVMERFAERWTEIERALGLPPPERAGDVDREELPAALYQ